MRCRALALAVALTTPTSPALAQSEPPGTGGLAALDLALRQLGHHKRVLLIGAHPDDEDTELLTILVRGAGAQAAYLALNRGEGGQNGIGPELGVELGVLRTEELLAARRIDGASQFFTRAFDFGYSKSIEETFQAWPRDSILKDVVRIVRRFRPQVVVTTFVGAPREGHGQHRAAGLVALEAFRAAGDPARFPELATEEALAPHAPLKLYRSTRFDTAATSMELEGGALDPVLGRSYHQIAMASRSMHRSQDFGLLQRPGPSRVRLQLLGDRTGRGDGGFFSGVDTSLVALAAGAEATHLDEFARAVETARAVLHPATPGAIAPALARAHAALETATTLPLRPDLSAVLAEQRMLVERALAAAAGVVVDAVSDREALVAMEPVGVTVTVWNAGDAAIVVREATITVPGRDRERMAPDSFPQVIRPGALVTLRAAPPLGGVPVSRPYHLAAPMDGALYRWPRGAAGWWGEPFEPPPIVASVDVEINGRRVTLVREVVYRYADQAVGEVRRPLHVVPRVGVALDPPQLLWPQSSLEPRTLTVTLTHYDTTTVAGTVALELPDGWPRVDSQPFVLTRRGEQQSFRFAMRFPPRVAPGSYRVAASARAADGSEYRESVVAIEYPHVRTRFLVDSAVASVRVVAITMPSLSRVGYVRGASDRVPEALRAVGLPVEILDDDALRRGEFAAYDAIVVGTRAYETNRVLVETNARLLDYVRRGGLAIVQYQQYQYVRGGFAPYPLEIARPHDRVTDEAAPPMLLAADHPVFRMPNVIGDDAWAGWVQERGLYFPSRWDPAYTPLVAFADHDEEPKAGALLVAAVGRGTYVYTGLSFFRQLPAGVPGAFRLFANLLALRGGDGTRAGGR